MSEPTIAEKLKQLNVQPGQLVTENQQDGFVPVPSTSLAQTLAQALHSSDNRLLESCFVHSKENIIKNTVKRLPSPLVLPLVDALVVRLGRGGKGYGAGESGVNATRGRGLIEWLRLTLIIHAAHLVTIPTLQQRLGALQKTVNSRLQLHQPLLELQGRLDLAVSQIELRRDAASAMAARKRALQQNEAQIVVEGAEDEDQDMGEDNSEDEEGKVAMPKANGTGLEDSDDEGSIEDVMLNGHISDDESDGQGEHVGAGLSGFLDLEADESGDEEAIGDSEAEALDAASDEDESDSEDGSDSSED